MVSKHIAERPVPIERLRPDTPRPLAGAVMRALEKQPSDRWQTGEEFRQAVAGERPAPPARSRSRRQLISAAVAALVLLVATVALARRSPGPPSGVNPRHSILVLPFDNLRNERSVEWLRDGSVSMLGLNLSQWNDLTVVDHERLHDLLVKHDLKVGDDIGLDMARRLAREAGVWTVVLGDFTPAGDSLHLTARVFDVASGKRVDVARVDDRAGSDVRPMFDALAAKLLDLSGAPNEIRIGLARSTTRLTRGVSGLPPWAWTSSTAGTWPARSGISSARLPWTRPSAWPTTSWRSPGAGWSASDDSVTDRAILRATTYSGNLPPHERTVINAYRAFYGGEYTRGPLALPATCWPATRATPMPGTVWARPGSTTLPGPIRRRPGPRRCAPSSRPWPWTPTTPWRTTTSMPC